MLKIKMISTKDFFGITGLVLSGIFILILSLTSTTTGQVSSEWADYNTLNQCRVTFSHPTNWIVSDAITRNRFDTGDPSLVRVSSPDEIQHFSLMTCYEWELNEKAKSHNDTDALFTEYVNNTFLSGFDKVTDPTGVEIIEMAHLVPDLVSNSTLDANVFALKKNDAGIEGYIVLNNGIVYAFYYEDLADHFDSIENKQIRDRILGSLKFQY